MQFNTLMLIYKPCLVMPCHNKTIFELYILREIFHVMVLFGQSRIGAFAWESIKLSLIQMESLQITFLSFGKKEERKKERNLNKKMQMPWHYYV